MGPKVNKSGEKKHIHFLSWCPPTEKTVKVNRYLVKSSIRNMLMSSSRQSPPTETTIEFGCCWLWFFLLFLVKAAYKEAMILKLGLFFFILIPVSRLCLPVRLVLSMREQSRGRHTIHLPGHVKKNRRRFLFSSQVESIPCLFIYLLSVCISRQFLFVFCFAPGGGSDEEELRRWLGSAFFFFFFFFF